MFVVNTHLDICYAVNTLSQFMTEPLHAYWVVAKHILIYFLVTITVGLRYTTGDIWLHGYSDADWAGNVIDKKSMSGCCFSLGFAMISCMRRKHKSVLLSIVDVEYIVASMASYKKFGRGSSLETYSSRSWTLQWYIGTTKVGSNRQKISHSMTSPSI